MVPFDTRSPFITSGIRLGSPAVTTRGMKEDEMKTIVELIDIIIQNSDDEDVQGTVRLRVKELCAAFPLYASLQETMQS